MLDCYFGHHHRKITAEGCGTLSSSPVKEGHNAKLEFVPNKVYSQHNRKWMYNPRDNEYLILLDSANTTFVSDKYSEETTEKGYILIIKEASFENGEGTYAVLCQENPWVYSNVVRLDVLKAESTTFILYTHKRFTTNRKNVNVTNFTTSKPPSKTAVYIATTQRKEVTPTTVLVPNTQRSSTDEGRNVSITSKQPSTTPVNSVISDEKEVKPTTSIHVPNTHRSSTDEGKNISITSIQPSTTAVNSSFANELEDDEEPIKEIPNQSTTKKEKENTSVSREEEKGINTAELKLLIPITVSVVGIVVAVAVGTVCVTVRKKKRNEETHIERSEVESDDKGDSHRDGRSAEVVQGPGGFQEQVHPSSSDARSVVLAQASEPPEYASVIPKEKRASEAKQTTKKANYTLICENKETENQLVYAELDLQPGTNNRPTTSRYEATEYVTIDFSKTGTSAAEKGLPEKTDTTEYVSVDFSRTGTSAADTGLPEQQDTTEHVSVDLSKKAELQAEDQGAAI